MEVKSTPPGLVKKIKAVAASESRWVRAGRPTRSDERIKEIFETICMPCEFYKETGEAKGRCMKCGCRLESRLGVLGGVTNKLAMGTEKCPVDKWGPETD